MKIKRQSFKRPAYLAVAFVLAVAGVAQGLLSDKAFALPTGGSLINREIRMSTSRPGATGTTYLVAFQPASTYAVQGIIVDFCEGADTPIINDANCDVPAGFSIGTTPSVTVTSVNVGGSTISDLGAGTGASWVADDLFTGQSLILTHAGTGPTLTAGTKYGFTINNVTNPTATPGTTFYARIITYTDDTGDITTYAHNDAGDTEAEDYGGIALSTAAVINISAKVQETLVFCVSGPNGYTAPVDGDPIAPTLGDGCSSGVQTPSITLGHGNNDILDSSATDWNSAYFQVSTNAQSGINVRMKNSNTCGGLSRNGGTSCDIAPVGGLADPDGDNAIAFGAAALFGMRVIPGSGITAGANYDSGTNYGMNFGDTSGTGLTDNVVSTYGSLIASSAAPLNSIESEVRFAATATLTTPAGLYSADMILVATGTF